MQLITRKASLFLILAVFLFSFTSFQIAEAALCMAPDNGGTVENPISACEYATNPGDAMEIITGLPVGTTIELVPILQDLPLAPATVINPGGNFGPTGEVEQDSGVLLLDIDGTGTLAGFSRLIGVPVDIEGHSAPRTPGDAVQSFETEMVTIDGEIFGDPDFCTLRIKAGSSIPLPPSLGQTTLTDLGGNFQVDSFFDVVYTIEFQGCPGSLLEGYSGTTQGTVRILTQDSDGDGLPDGQDPGPNDPCNPNPSSPSCNSRLVGGQMINVDAAALILAGSQMTAAWLIPVIISGIGFGIVIARRF